MTQDFAPVAKAKYVSLTTFRKDGTPVATPLWAAPDGDKLVIWTETNSWKVKRIRRNPAVTVQECDIRGKPKEGAPVLSGTATILDANGTDHVRSVIMKKYGIIGLLVVKASLLRRGKDGTIGIEVSPA